MLDISKKKKERKKKPKGEAEGFSFCHIYKKQAMVLRQTKIDEM